MNGEGGEGLYYLIMVALIIFPIWRILSRTGLKPAWSLLAFIPLLGLPIVSFILAIAQWPTLPTHPASREEIHSA